MSRRHQIDEFFMNQMADLQRDIEDRKKETALLKAQLAQENRMIRTMEMDLANKVYELKMTQRKINRLDSL